MTPLPAAAAAEPPEYPPLSALNDLLFCPRRCFLHRVEGVWVENAHTAAGTLDHRRVHAARESVGRAADGGPTEWLGPVPTIGNPRRRPGSAFGLSTTAPKSAD
ncbi:MAG: hypothetical protein K2P78_01100, partial [Gemmataceae bacterium]|nr:hypothetical protein [Gemmataceae bacterium]